LLDFVFNEEGHAKNSYLEQKKNLRD
jgi:hypothetical protein